MSGTEHQVHQPREPRPAVRTLIYVLFGPIVWAVHLTIIYGLQSVACALTTTSRGGTSMDAVQLAIVSATIAAVLALGAGWRWLANPGGAMSEGTEDRNHFLEGVMQFLVGLSVLGVLGAGAAAMMLPSCPALR